MKVIVNRPWAALSLAPLLENIYTFRRWWLGEFFNLLANRSGRWLLGPQRRVLWLEATTDIVRFSLAGENDALIEAIRVPSAEYSKITLESFLQTHGLSRDEVDLAVRLPYDRFFCRSLQLPAEASRHLDEIVVRDMERKTSFRADNIYQHYWVKRSSDSKKLMVFQWVIKQQFVREALSLLQLDASEVSFVDAEALPDEESVALILLPHGHDQDRPWYWTWLRMLSVSFTVLLFAALGTKLWHQQSAIDSLEAQINSTRAKAQQVRAQIERLERKQSAISRVRADKAMTPSLLDIWEMTSAILPSHSWLTELKLSQSGSASEQQLSLIGFSDAAASLVGLFDASSHFTDASLTSPISLDPVESRERFSIQMKVRSFDLGKAGTP